MERLVKSIYEKIICYEPDAKKMDKCVNAEIEKLIAPYIGQLTEDELTKLKSLLYQVSLTAEQEGFQLGMKYLYKLYCILQSD